MRNRNGGEESPDWWHNLPPKVRTRFGPCRAEEPEPEVRPQVNRPAEQPPNPGPSPTLARVLELSRLALVFLVVGVANVAFLVMALAFLDGRPPAILMPGR